MPTTPAFEGLRRAWPLSPVAPARVRPGQGPAATDDAEAILRRRVALSFPSSIDASVRQRQLEASGLFRQVVRLPDRPTPARWAQANTEPFGAASSDPHRWQWALQAIEAPGATGAWHLTTGRATVASLESGIALNHQDVPATALANFRQHNSTRVFWNEDPGQGPFGLQIRPDQLQFAPGRPTPHHGTHVNTLMAAPINGLGIAGVCPTCTLQTIRSETDFSGEAATLLAGRFGATSLNMSFEPFAVAGIVQTDWLLALNIAHERDIVLVAAAGNNRQARNNWDYSPGFGSVPHGSANVMKIGATDADNYLWNEARIVALPINPPPPTKARRHPVKAPANLCTSPGDANCIPWVISDRCAGPSDGSQCGSTFGFVPNIIDLVAPGAQVVGGMVTGQPSTPGVYIALPPDSQNPTAQAPSQTGLGVGTNGVATNDPSPSGHSWGPMTGTSMATPHVTATAGLMRSINPLLSAPAVRQALRDSANPSVPGYWEPAMGAGLLNARRAVEKAAGSIRGTVQRNRLVPMFALYATSTTVPGEIANEELETFGSQELHAWLYTTNPSLVAAANKMDIYQSTNAAFSPTMLAAYEHSHLLFPTSRRIGIPVPPAMYTLPVGAAKGFRNPAASFWVFTTPHSPLAEYTLRPLYRLSTHHAPACEAEQRKHLYETRADKAALLIGGTPVCGAQPQFMRYRFESIEGYVFDRDGQRPPGALALFRGYHAGRKVAALVVETENLTTAFEGYSVNTSTLTTNDDFLGWVYPSFVPTLTSTPSTTAADTDTDGLIDTLELAFGLNPLSPNSDCDGSNNGDAAEYGFANLPGDPMSPNATCTDGRLTAVYNASQQTVTVTLSNPIGPVSLPEGTTVRVGFTGPVNPPAALMSGGAHCISVPTIGWNSAYDCTLATPLPVGPSSTVTWEWTSVGGPLFQPGQNGALITATPGLTDPVPANNSASF